MTRQREILLAHLTGKQKRLHRNKGKPIPEEVLLLLLPIAVIAIAIAVIHMLASDASDDEVTLQLRQLGFNKKQISYLLKARSSY